MALRTRKLSDALGVEIGGVDLSQELSDAVMREIEALWHRHSLLLFRDQDLTPEDHKRFTRFFGEFQLPHAGAQQGAETLYLPPDQAKRFIADEIVKYRDIITKAGIPKID